LLAAVFVVWIAAILIANPRGNFPIDDDWCFIQPAQAFARSGDVRLPWCAQMTLVTQLAWAGAFVTATHFSIEMLRLSTLLLAGAGLVAVWCLAREVGASPTTAAVASAAFALNPIVFQLSNTFMTDVPAAAWAAFAALALTRALKRPNTATLAAATVFSLCTVFVRQPGVLLPIMFAPAFLSMHGASRRTIAPALIPGVIAVSCLLGFQTWITVTGRRGEYYAHFMGGLSTADAAGPLIRAADAAKRLAIIVFHASWWTLPMLLWTQSRPDSRRARRWFAGALVAGLLVFVPLSRTAPWGSSLLVDFAIGPPMLRGSDLPGMPVPHAPRIVWVVWSAAAGLCLAIGLLRVGLYARSAMRDWRTTDRFRLAMMILSTAVVTATIGAMAALQFYDRYMLFLIPLFIVVCVLTSDTVGPTAWPAMRVTALGFLAMFAVLAALSTHDLFALNRARWLVIDRIVASRQYATADIDGGVEFWRWKEPDHKPPDHPKIVVALGNLVGFQPCSAVPFTRWLPLRHDQVVVLVPSSDRCPSLAPSPAEGRGSLSTSRTM
jgi:hypothetical protein